MNAQTVSNRVAWIQSSEVIDGYYMNCVESVMSSPEVSREFIRGGGITPRTIAERAWELAVEMMNVRNENYRPTGVE